MTRSDTQIRLLKINNQVADIPQVGRWLEQQLQLLDLPAKLIFKFNLCAEEVITNIISYAFPEFDGSHEIELKLSVDDKQASLQIEDDGVEFNPLDKPEHTQPHSLEEANIGGLGIDLIRHYMDECSYHRQNEKNLLIMTSNIAQPD